MAYQMIPSRAVSQFSRDQIQEKFEKLLRDFPGLQRYKHSPGLAVLFDEIDYRQEIISVLEHGVTDYWIPIPRMGLPMSLDPGVFVRFQGIQQSILTSDFVVGKRWGGHCHLSQDAIDAAKFIPKSLTFKEILGRGGTADVAKVESASGKLYALKRIRRKRDFSEAQEQMRYIQMELGVLRKIHNVHYIKLVGSYTETRHVGILMDPVAECNLLQYLDGFSRQSRDPGELAGFFGCLATALANLHYRWHIRHKDIKPQNILVKDQTVLLTDFGISLDWSESGHTTTRQEQNRSPIYCAPEAAEDRARNSKTDIWSLGCVFLEMTAVLKGRERRFVDDTLRQYGSTNFRNSPDGISAVIAELREDTSRCGNTPLEWVEKMLQQRKEDRPNSRDLRETILRSEGQRGLEFCGICCTGDMMFDDDESDDSQSYESVPTSSHSMADDRLDPVRRQCISILDPCRCKWHRAEVTEHGGSQNNWISPSLVGQCNLKSRKSPRVESMKFRGESFESTRMVTITWIDNRVKKTRQSDCLIAPKTAPFELLVGKTFISSFGWRIFDSA
ncbi:kinase-like protein [Whalleya microplaca]|nr:kinase-like protein [Whalleya microplaca]